MQHLLQASVSILSTKQNIIGKHSIAQIFFLYFGLIWQQMHGAFRLSFSKGYDLKISDRFSM